MHRLTRMRAFAENAGLQSISMLADIKSRQIAEKNGHSECPQRSRGCSGLVCVLTRLLRLPPVGVDCMSGRTQDMKDVLVFESLIGKKQQLLLATQLVKMVLVRSIVRSSDLSNLA